jgi:hypothetical protein
VPAVSSNAAQGRALNGEPAAQKKLKQQILDLEISGKLMHRTGTNHGIRN